MNNQKISPLVIIVSIALIFGFILFYNLKNSPSRLDSYHTEIYNGAKGWFVSDLKAEPIIPEVSEGEDAEPARGFRVTWNKPTKKYNHFLLTLTNTATGEQILESGESERVSLDFYNLMPESNYEIALQACLKPTCKKWLVSKTEVSITTNSEE